MKASHALFWLKEKDFNPFCRLHEVDNAQKHEKFQMNLKNLKFPKNQRMSDKGSGRTPESCSLSIKPSFISLTSLQQTSLLASQATWFNISQKHSSSLEALNRWFPNSGPQNKLLLRAGWTRAEIDFSTLNKRWEALFEKSLTWPYLWALPREHSGKAKWYSFTITPVSVYISFMTWW